MRLSDICLAAALFGAVFVTPLSSQQQTVGIFRVAFNEPGLKNQEFAEPIVLKLSGSTTVPHDFHARLFRGSVASLLQRKPDPDGCVHFDTAILDVTVRGNIVMRALDDPAWLHPAGDGFQPEQYTIVFESGAEQAIEVLRLHPNELNDYFRYAFSMNLIPPENLRRKVAETVRQVETTLQQSAITYQEATKSTCWRVKTLVAEDLPVRSSDTFQVAELSPCAASSVPGTESAKPALPVASQ